MSAAERHWLEYPGGVPVEKWGSDHESTLLYAETRAVDHQGWLPVGDKHMRGDGRTYPTRLSDGTMIVGHSDWECLDDAEAAGFLTYDEELYPGDRRTAGGIFRSRSHGSHESRGGPGLVTFTDAGWAYVHQLRRRRAEAALA